MGHSYPPMPQTIEEYKKLAQRDLELIEEQRETIAKQAQTINDLRQRLERIR